MHTQPHLRPNISLIEQPACLNTLLPLSHLRNCPTILGYRDGRDVDLGVCGCGAIGDVDRVGADGAEEVRGERKKRASKAGGAVGV